MPIWWLVAEETEAQEVEGSQLARNTAAPGFPTWHVFKAQAQDHPVPGRARSNGAGLTGDYCHCPSRSASGIRFSRKSLWWRPGHSLQRVRGRGGVWVGKCNASITLIIREEEAKKPCVVWGAGCVCVYIWSLMVTESPCFIYSVPIPCLPKHTHQRFFLLQWNYEIKTFRYIKTVFVFPLEDKWKTWKEVPGKHYFSKVWAWETNTSFLFCYAGPSTRPSSVHGGQRVIFTQEPYRPKLRDDAPTSTYRPRKRKRDKLGKISSGPFPDSKMHGLWSDSYMYIYSKCVYFVC